MLLTSTRQNAIQIITVNDARIDSVVAIQFKDAMRAETEKGPNHVILDLSAVGFIDSSGLGAIVATMKQLGNDRRLDLAGLTPAVDRVFKLTRMDSVFKLFATLDAALEAT